MAAHYHIIKETELMIEIDSLNDGRLCYEIEIHDEREAERQQNGTLWCTVPERYSPQSSNRQVLVLSS